MKIQLLNNTFMNFKNLNVHVIKISDAFNKKSDPNIRELLNGIVQFYNITSRSMTQYEKLELWKHHHKNLHVSEKPELLKHSYVEKLLNDVYDNKDLHESMISDLFNYINLKYLIPVVFFDFDKFENSDTITIDADDRFSLNFKINDKITLLHSLGDFLNQKYKVTMETKNIVCFAFKLDFVNDLVFENMMADLSQLIYISFNTKPLIKVVNNNSYIMDV